mgnify:CR=1 FL=1
MCDQCEVRRDLSLEGFGDFHHLPGCPKANLGMITMEIPVREPLGKEECIKRIQELTVED